MTTFAVVIGTVGTIVNDDYRWVSASWGATGFAVCAAGNLYIRSLLLLRSLVSANLKKQQQSSWNTKEKSKEIPAAEGGKISKAMPSGSSPSLRSTSPPASTRLQECELLRQGTSISVADKKTQTGNNRNRQANDILGSSSPRTPRHTNADELSVNRTVSVNRSTVARKNRASGAAASGNRSRMTLWKSLLHRIDRLLLFGFLSMAVVVHVET